MTGNKLAEQYTTPAVNRTTRGNCVASHSSELSPLNLFFEDFPCGTEVEIYDSQVNILRKHQENCHGYGVTIDGFWIDDRIYWTL
jgi:hypothetical protein